MFHQPPYTSPKYIHGSTSIPMVARSSHSYSGIPLLLCLNIFSITDVLNSGSFSRLFIRQEYFGREIPRCCCSVHLGSYLHQNVLWVIGPVHCTDPTFISIYSLPASNLSPPACNPVTLHNWFPAGKIDIFIYKVRQGWVFQSWNYQIFFRLLRRPKCWELCVVGGWAD